MKKKRSHVAERRLLMEPSFGERAETVTGSRYRWNNAQRGKERFVIIQRTITGEGQFLFGGLTHAVPAKHAFLAIVPEPSEYFHAPGRSGAWSFDWMNFYGPLAVSLWAEFRERFGPVVLLPDDSSPMTLFRKLLLGLKAGGEDVHRMSADAYAFLMEWTRWLERSECRPVDAVSRVVELCRERYREPIGVKELAAEVGISREHLTRIFAERTGSSPARFLRSLRHDAARTLRAQSRLSAKEIAMRCGLSSLRRVEGSEHSPFG